jgi:hypothetical protein
MAPSKSAWRRLLDVPGIVWIAVLVAVQCSGGVWGILSGGR